MPRSKKGLGRCHKSGTGNNQGRLRTTPRDKKCLDINHINSKNNDPCLLSEHYHQVILEKLKQDKILTMMNMWKKKITTMLIVMNLILIPINNSYYMFNILWTTIGGTYLIACKTPTNVISSVSLPEHI